MQVSVRPLSFRPVESRFLLLSQALIADVAHHADDLTNQRLTPEDSQAASKRILAGQETVYQSLVDNQLQRARCRIDRLRDVEHARVGIREVAAGIERHAERGKVSGRYRARESVQLLTGR